MPRLGILAGGGALPRLVAEACRSRGRPYHVVALDGFAEEWVGHHPHTHVPLVAISRMISALREAGCGELVLAGAVRRPAIDDAAIDAEDRVRMSRLLAALPHGDDDLLGVVRELFEEEGLSIVGVDTVIDLRVPAGILGRVEPGAGEVADVAKGRSILSALAPLDVSQGCVVADGRVLGIETIQGTDALLEFVRTTRDLAQGARGGVLVKRAKAGQDRRVDAPTIGPETVERASRAGLDGIALEAGAVQVIDLREVVSAADAAGLFLWGSE